MKVYETSNQISISPKVWKSVYFVLLSNLAFFIIDVHLFLSNYLLIESCAFFLLLLLLSNPRSRQVYRLIFDEEDSVLVIYYMQYVFFAFKAKISYKSLNYKYAEKIYVRGNAPKTISIYSDKSFVAEIKQKYNLGWGEDDVEKIYLELLGVG